MRRGAYLFQGHESLGFIQIGAYSQRYYDICIYFSSCNSGLRKLAFSGRMRPDKPM